MYTVISTTGDRTSYHRSETLQLSHQFISLTSDAKLTSHLNCAAKFSGHGHSIHNIIPLLKKENVHLYHHHHHHHDVRLAQISLTLSLSTSPYHLSPPAGLQGYIPYHHIAAVWMFELVVLLLIGHMRSPQEHITYDLVLASPAVSGMSGSSSTFIYIYIHLLNIYRKESLRVALNCGQPTYIYIYICIYRIWH